MVCPVQDWVMPQQNRPSSPPTGRASTASCRLSDGANRMPSDRGLADEIQRNSSPRSKGSARRLNARTQQRGMPTFRRPRETEHCAWRRDVQVHEDVQQRPVNRAAHAYKFSNERCQTATRLRCARSGRFDQPIDVRRGLQRSHLRRPQRRRSEFRTK